MAVVELAANGCCGIHVSAVMQLQLQLRPQTWPQIPHPHAQREVVELRPGLCLIRWRGQVPGLVPSLVLPVIHGLVCVLRRRLLPERLPRSGSSGGWTFGWTSSEYR